MGTIRSFHRIPGPVRQRAGRAPGSLLDAAIERALAFCTLPGSARPRHGDLKRHLRGGYAAGGDGNDSLSGGAGSDNLSGDNGNDPIDGQGQDDVMVGGRGDDLIWFGDFTAVPPSPAMSCVLLPS